MGNGKTGQVKRMKKLAAVVLSMSLLLYPVMHHEARCVALTFDDGPSGAVTDRLLDGLAQRNAKATFFLCGYRVEQYPQELNRMVEEGHEVGLHSCCHQFMHQMSGEQIREELTNELALLEEYAAVRARLFRPPGGLYSQTLLDAAKELDLRVILWSVDPQDWDRVQTGKVLPRLLAGTADGDVVLLHDLYDSSVDAALTLVDQLQAQGYRFCTVSELARHRGETLLPGMVYRSFKRKNPGELE